MADTRARCAAVANFSVAVRLTGWDLAVRVGWPVALGWLDGPWLWAGRIGPAMRVGVAFRLFSNGVTTVAGEYSGTRWGCWVGQVISARRTAGARLTGRSAGGVGPGFRGLEPDKFRLNLSGSRALCLRGRLTSEVGPTLYLILDLPAQTIVPYTTASGPRVGTAVRAPWTPRLERL